MHRVTMSLPDRLRRESKPRRRLIRHVHHEVDVVRALARVLGIKNVQFSDVDFDSILSQVDNGTYDMAAAAMTVKKSRMRDLNMVAYIQSGFIYGTQKKQPQKF